MSPTYGGWGGRYVWRQPSRRAARRSGRRAATRIPAATTRATPCVGIDGKTHTSDQATIWRWRDGVPARLRGAHGLDDQDVARRESQSRGRRERQAGKAPIMIDARVGVAVDARCGGHARSGRQRARATRGSSIRKPAPASPHARYSERRRADLEPRVAIDNPAAARITVTPRIAGIAHIILAVEDDGTPSLTSYRRVILTIKAGAAR